MTYYTRMLESEIERSLEVNPVTSILGPRQCGKSTLAKHLIGKRKDVIFLDLERSSDLRKLEDPEWYLQTHHDKLICIDEIQYRPELFPLIRSLVDDNRRAGMYLILGSASRELLQQSSESLAGRISFKYLSPFLITEAPAEISLETYLSRGGFPPSLFAGEDMISYSWLQDFISTFLERDLLQFAGFTPMTMRRLWQMLAHSNGQTVNYSKLASSLGVSHNTVRNYIDLLEGTFMVNQLSPYFGNTKKRLVRAPKVYITDVGIINALLQLYGFDAIYGHPVFGSLWESLVLTHLQAYFPLSEFSFYRTNHGNEIDIILEYGTQKITIECKASAAPTLTVGNHKALEDIKPDYAYIVAHVKESYPTKWGEVVTIEELIVKIAELTGQKEM